MYVNDPSATTITPTNISGAEIASAIRAIPGTSVEQVGDDLAITNRLDGVRLYVDSSTAEVTAHVKSPWAEVSLGLSLPDRGTVLISPDDLAFSIRSGSLGCIRGTPVSGTVRDLMSELEALTGEIYTEADPEQSKRYYSPLRYKIECAQFLGLDLDREARILDQTPARAAVSEIVEGDLGWCRTEARDLACGPYKLRAAMFDEAFVARWNRAVPIKPWDFYYTLTAGLPEFHVMIECSASGNSMWILTHGPMSNDPDLKLKCMNYGRHVKLIFHHVEAWGEYSGLPYRIAKNVLKLLHIQRVTRIEGPFELIQPLLAFCSACPVDRFDIHHFMCSVAAQKANGTVPELIAKRLERTARSIEDTTLWSLADLQCLREAHNSCKYGSSRS